MCEKWFTENERTRDFLLQKLRWFDTPTKLTQCKKNGSLLYVEHKLEIDSSSGLWQK
jgi:hypothetical protein